MIRRQIRAAALSCAAVMLTAVFPSCSARNIPDSESGTEPVTFTLYSADLDSYRPFTDSVAREITARTGVVLEFSGPRQENDEEISMMIASGEYPDLIYAKSALVRLVDAGAVIPLDGYIKDFGRNMTELYGNRMARLRLTLDDPRIYSVGTFEIRTEPLEASGSLQIQNAVLKELGYPRIRTLDDYENAMLAYMKKYPVINGHRTIGLSLLTDSWQWYVGLSNPGSYVLGLPDDGQWTVDQQTMRVQYKFLNPDMKIFYRWLNRLYHEGLLDPESFTQHHDIWESKLEGGYVLGTSYPHWGLKGIHSRMIQKDMSERSMAYLPVTVTEMQLEPSFKNYGFSGGWGIAISRSCPDPERAFRFLDWMCSEEAQVLVNWGIKDQHYYIDRNGRRRALPGADDESSGVGVWVYPFPQAGPGRLDSTGNSIVRLSPESVMEEYSDAEKETLAAYGVSLWKELFPTAEELGESRYGQMWQYPLSAAMSARLDDTDRIVKESLIKMIIGDSGNFDEAWDRMTAEITAAGISEAEDELTELVATKMKLWGE